MATKTFPVGDSLYTEKFCYFTLSTNSEGKTYETLINEKLASKLSTWKLEIYKVLLAKWYNYEITAETEDEQFTFISTIIDMFDSYYSDKLTAYLKQFDYETACLLTDTKTSTIVDNGTSSIDNTGETHTQQATTGHNESSSTATGSETETPNLKHDNIDLPNKVTTKEYVTSRTADTGTDETATTATNTGSDDTTGSNTGSGTSSASTDITDTRNKSVTDEENIIDKSKYLEQKKKYLDLLENVYLEFADKFSDCFIHIFS